MRGLAVATFDLFNQQQHFYICTRHGSFIPTSHRNCRSIVLISQHNKNRLDTISAASGKSSRMGCPF